MASNDLHHARMFKAFCDENRISILRLLQSGEKCACVLLEQLKIGQSTLSHHMKILVESQMVIARTQGKWTYYSICLSQIQKATMFLSSLEVLAPTDEQAPACD